METRKRELRSSSRNATSNRTNDAGSRDETDFRRDNMIREDRKYDKTLSWERKEFYRTQKNAGERMYKHSDSEDDDGYEDRSYTPDNFEYNQANAKQNASKCVRISWLHMILVSAITGFVALLIAFNGNIYNAFDTTHPVIINLKDEVKSLSNKFPNQQPEIWDHLEIGVEKIADNRTEKELAIFFLVQFSNEEDTAMKISNATGDIISRILSYSDNLIISPNEFDTLDKGELVSKYEEKLKSSHVMIIPNVERIFSKNIQDLRYFCDEYNPVVPDAIIFLTMDINGCDDAKLYNFKEFSKNNIITYVEKCLIQLWGRGNGLSEDVIRALLARFLSVVLEVY